MPDVLPAAMRPAGRAAMLMYGLSLVDEVYICSSCLALQSITCHRDMIVMSYAPVRKAGACSAERAVTCTVFQVSATSSSEAPPAAAVQPRSRPSSMQCAG